MKYRYTDTTDLRVQEDGTVLAITRTNFGRPGGGNDNIVLTRPKTVKVKWDTLDRAIEMHGTGTRYNYLRDCGAHYRTVVTINGQPSGDDAK